MRRANRHLPRGLFDASARLHGVAVWAAYGIVEMCLGVVLRPIFLPADRRFTLFLLLLYPLAGALLGRFAVHGLALAFAACALVTIAGPAVAVPLVSAAVAVALFRRRAWFATLTLFVPTWAVRDTHIASTAVTKALLAVAIIVLIGAIGAFTARLRWTRKPWWTLAAYVPMMAFPLFLTNPTARDLAPEQPPPHAFTPNVLLIVMDTVRADHLSVYGYGRNTTPHLAELAKGATRYVRAYAPSNMTLSSHASLFTGLSASEHTAHVDSGWMLGRPLPPRAITAAEILSSRGYATASIAANGYLGPGFGLDQGFQHLSLPAPKKFFGSPSSNYSVRAGVEAIAARVIRLPRRSHLNSAGGEVITGRAIAYLDRVSGKRRPFFLVLNYLDAHHPYIPPPPYATMFPGFDFTQPADLEAQRLDGFLKGQPRLTGHERAHMISQYDGAIAFLDVQIARVIGALRKHGLFDRTMIIVLSDHGESFGEHGAYTHGFTTYDSETRVPLIVKAAGQTAGAVVQAPTSLLDVWPLITMTPRPPAAVVTEAFPLSKLAAIPPRRPGTAMIDGAAKTIVNADGSVETYDLAADPAEARNLAPNEVSRRMAPAIASWRRSLRGLDASTTPQAVDPETYRRLRALGYVR